ncbi:MAG TPA: LL-diaminopimelate aminotransferase [Candidatus Faeciplasma gallinarum]|uniref:LL-diaminopimelate aminotransferase n=1 Tax=Candidatus Faeciplasma gallinarum TaxID=2840799 RepID=A0A9D1ENA5_9FIRM|nr:LL-diaminopimelate aminotransferase [Candidatus Faeciplasma gallinarum]
MKTNHNFSRIKENYLFAEVAQRTAKYASEHPEANIIKMGIGDVTLPLCSAVIDAMHKAVSEMGVKETFKGYGEYRGYDFLCRSIVNYYKNSFGVDIDTEEVFVSEGAKSDLGNILDLFDNDNIVLVTDPVYPVYVDTNLLAGRKVIYADATEENNFLPLPDDSVKADIIYLCSPNNPTGAAYTKDQLKLWVDYAKKQGAIILLDAAYEAFITDSDVPHSAYEVEGAKQCVIEICSLSKTAGFTGTRCGYTIVPKALKYDQDLNKLWLRRQSTKFNGVSYIIQCGANAVFTPEGQKGVKENIAYYQENAKILMQALDECGIKYFGGKNSPYIWLKCPNGMGSWEFFDKLLSEANVVGTPGEGFGENGKGYLRLTSFSTHENTREAMARLKKMLGK